MAITRLGTYSQIKGSSYKLPCKVVTSSSISLTGGAPLVVDGYTLATNDRVLAISQSTATQNGIYLVTTPGSGNNGTWVRAADFSLSDDAFQGTQVYITTGSVNRSSTYALITPDPIILDTTNLTFGRTEKEVFTKSAALVNNALIQQTDTGSFVVWRANVPCTAISVLGYRDSGSGAVINAIKNGSNLLATNLSINVSGSWVSSSTLQNNNFNVGDTLAFNLVNFTGSITELIIQVDFI
jgi:hypothetical protein